MDKKDIFQKMNQAILDGDAAEVGLLAKTAVEKIDPLELVNEGMTPAMKAVGEKFGCAAFYLFLPVRTTKRKEIRK